MPATTHTHTHNACDHFLVHIFAALYIAVRCFPLTWIEFNLVCSMVMSWWLCVVRKFNFECVRERVRCVKVLISHFFFRFTFFFFFFFGSTLKISINGIFHFSQHPFHTSNSFVQLSCSVCASQPLAELLFALRALCLSHRNFIILEWWHVHIWHAAKPLPEILSSPLTPLIYANVYFFFHPKCLLFFPFFRN